jgi:hypothetical protein
MAFMDACDIQVAGDYLLNLLRAEGPVEFERFYDGKEKTAVALREAMGWSTPVGWKWCPFAFTCWVIDEPLPPAEDNSTECALTLAIHQLEEAGLITTRRNGYVLEDDNPDYDISLTAAGEAFVASGQNFRYRDAEKWLKDAALPWRPKDDPSSKFPGNDKFSEGMLWWCRDRFIRPIKEERFGALGLGLGSLILVSGKKPPGVDDPGDTQLRRQLGIVRDGLAGAGAEELWHLVFGGGFLLLAKPAGLPLYDTTASVEAEQMRAEADEFDKVRGLLAALARRAYEEVYGTGGAEPVG